MAEKKGSPPRMREECLKSYALKHIARITPAHAGRMPMFLFVAVLPWDHPRACGKNLL